MKKGRIMSISLEQIDKTTKLAENNQLSLMVFQVQNPTETQEKPSAYYGINVFKVREVLEAKSYGLSKLPDSNRLIEGMIQLRGKFIPVVDLPGWLGFPMSEADRANSVIIIADFSHNYVGLRVANIYGVEEKGWEEILPAENYGMTSEDSFVINHTFLSQTNALCFILDVERLLMEALPEVAAKMFQEVESVESGQFSPFLTARTLLVADDSRAIQQYLAGVFNKAGIPHLMFDNGRKLLDHLVTMAPEEISLVFTDLEMPEASGHTVIKEIRANPRYAKLPIVVHSSMTSENNAREVYRMGADYFAGKIDTDAVIKDLHEIDVKFGGAPHRSLMLS
jgi:two-component system chemotaxis response regulator CheV